MAAADVARADVVKADAVKVDALKADAEARASDARMERRAMAVVSDAQATKVAATFSTPPPGSPRWSDD